MIEGQSVQFAAPDFDGVAQGDHGRLLVLDQHTAHVLWTTGSRAGQATMVDAADLTGTRVVASGLEDSLEMGGLTSFAVRETYETQGEAGVLNAMAQVGHLAAFADIAEEALVTVASRIRHDPSFREVLSHLDDEAGESLLRLATACLLRDAFGAQE